jgi:glycerol-3-phosphate dehydrogenase
MNTVVIIGGGIVGLAVFRALSTRNIKCILLEKNEDIISGASSGNSGIFHTGFDEPPNSIEMKCIRESWKQFKRITEQLGNNVIPHETTGALVVAWTKKDVEKLSDLLELARQNDVEVHLIEKNDLFKMEPNLNKKALGAVYVPGETLMNPWELAAFYLNQGLSAGSDFLTQTQVISGHYEAKSTEPHWQLHCNIKGKDQLLIAKIVINCAGNFADLVEQACEGGSRISDFKIKPRKGQFAVLEREASRDFTRIILPVPSDRTKGVLVSRTMYGNVIVGPTAEDQEHRSEALIDDEIIENILVSGQDMIPILSKRRVVGKYAGLRPASQYRDFQIGSARGWITVGGIRSTGLTASMGIGELVYDLYRKESGDLTDRTMTIYPHSTQKKISWNDNKLYIEINNRRHQVLHQLAKIALKDVYTTSKL